MPFYNLVPGQSWVVNLIFPNILAPVPCLDLGPHSITDFVSSGLPLHYPRRKAVHVKGKSLGFLHIWISLAAVRLYNSRHSASQHLYLFSSWKNGVCIT